MSIVDCSSVVPASSMCFCLACVTRFGQVDFSVLACLLQLSVEDMLEVYQNVPCGVTAHTWDALESTLPRWQPVDEPLALPPLFHVLSMRLWFEGMDA